MQADSTVDDARREVDRFRILCVGRSGVGKSSIINRVFGLQEASVAHWVVGKANIDQGLTSHENRFFVLHDSMGFEAGDIQNFDIVRKFMNERCEKSLPLKDRLHAVWLCTEAPTAGGRVFETGDEKLLQLAHETETPVVVVFTKYDRLLRSKRLELKGDNYDSDSNDLVEQSNEEARKVLESCVKSLTGAMNRFKMQMPRYAEVSIRPGYDAHISSLVEITGDLVQEKLKGATDAWVMWAIAQRASLPLKIHTCISTSTVHYRRILDGVRHSQMSLHDCLAKIHQDIITCWNFRDEKEILGSNGFKQLMLYLVQDVHESQNYSESHHTPPPAISKIFQFLDEITAGFHPTAPPTTTRDLMSWLKDTSLHNSTQVQRLLMTYTVDLTIVLKLLFDVTLAQMAQSLAGSPGTTWSELKSAFEEYENSGSRQRIHHRICLIFQQDQQISDTDSFHRIFCELAGVRASVCPPTATPHPLLALKPNPTRATTSDPSPVATPIRAPETTVTVVPVSGQSWWQRIRHSCLCL